MSYLFINRLSSGNKFLYYCSLSCLFFFISSSVFAVDYATTQAGLWSNASTWEGGNVPSDLNIGDRIFIRHEVTTLVNIEIPAGVEFNIETDGIFNNSDTDTETTEKPVFSIAANITFSGVFNNNEGGTLEISSTTATIPTEGTLNNIGNINFDGASTDFNILGKFNNSGLVEIDDTIAGEVSYIFDSGSTLSGNGTIEGDVTTPGTISPGNSPGTLTITGALVASGTINIEIAGSSNFDIINVTGSIDLTGATVVVSFTGYFPASLESYEFLTFSMNVGIDPTYDLPSTVSWNTTTFGTLEVTAILPVELTTFEANLENEQVNLFWRTANELNNSGFEVQHSIDGLAWDKIGFLDGVGTTIVPQDYSFEHATPNAGTNYYRLKQMDFDGQFEYSRVISLDLVGLDQARFNVFPNPAQAGEMTIVLPEGESAPILRLFSPTGQMLWQKTATNTIETIDLNGLTKGTYLIHIDDGKNVRKQRIVVQ